MNDEDEKGNSALTVASNYDRLTIVGLLLGNGAEVNFASPTGGTALMAACSFGRKELVQMLLTYGATVDNIEEASGFPVIVWAVVVGRNNIMDLLIQNGANVNLTEVQRQKIVRVIGPWINGNPEQDTPVRDNMHPRRTIQRLLELTNPLTAEEKRILRIE